MGGQEEKQICQDEHCDSGRPDAHCKTASPQGRQHKRALVHSLHCLNEENAPRASRQGEGAQAEVMGQEHFTAELIAHGSWSSSSHSWEPGQY